MASHRFIEQIPMKKFLIAALFSLSSGGLLLAQNIQLQPGQVKVDAPKTEVQKTPNFSADGVSNKDIPRPRDWLELEVKFEVDGRDDVIIPELLFRYYVGFRDKDGNPRTLTGDVTHLNVVCGEEYYSAAYVAPSKLGEITGEFRRFQDSSVAAVGVEVFYNGVVVGRGSTAAGNAAFWQKTGTEPGVLSKMKTPFRLLWIDRYAEFKADN